MPVDTGRLARHGSLNLEVPFSHGPKLTRSRRWKPSRAFPGLGAIGKLTGIDSKYDPGSR